MSVTKNKRLRVNNEIEAKKVRLIEPEGKQAGIVSLDAAKARAEAYKLDLVLIAENENPPVCKILDYGKHQFEQKKNKQANSKKQRQVQLKEIKMRPGTDEMDYQVKLRNLIRFLTQGDKAKVTVRFRGRELAHQEFGVMLLRRVENDLYEYGQVIQFPESIEGRQMVMIVVPLSKQLADKRRNERVKSKELEEHDAQASEQEKRKNNE